MSRIKCPLRGDPATSPGMLSDETGQGTALGSVIPAKAGIQSFLGFLDSRLRGSDDRDALASAGLTKTASYRTASSGDFAGQVPVGELLYGTRIIRIKA